MTPGLALQLEALDVRHPAANSAAVLALRGCSVQLQPGEQVAVIGPSGAGKTTLLHAAACALRPAGGRLHVGGQDPRALRTPALRQLRAQLFLAPQTPPLPPRQRVVTAVLAARLPRQGLWASLATLLRPRRAEAAAAHAALQAFDLGDKLWARVDRLSGGERQRVGLARALLAPAGLWLIDEPLSALDPTRAQQALRALTQGAQQRGATLLATLHQVELALAHFPRVLGLREGRLVFDLPAAAVTREQLAALYQSHEHELAGAMPGGDLAATPAERVLQIARC